MEDFQEGAVLPGEQEHVVRINNFVAQVEAA